MVKFRDLNNGKPDSTEDGKTRETDSRLSFRKLATEQQQVPAAKKIVSEKKASDKEQIGQSGEVLYKKAASYLKQVFDAVKQRKMFELDAGLQIIREMVEIQSFQDALFIEALHLDDPLQFIIHNNVNVAVYAIKMAENLGFDKDRQIEIGMAGLLHDIGMALIPEKLIYKQQKLSEAEFKIFKERPNYSYKILKSLGEDYLYLAECAVQVNERLDGSGYPQGLQGNEINEYAQIIGLVDMYEALIHSRPQRVKFHHFTAVKEIIKSGKHLFRREHLKALLNIFSIFPLHSYVQLNSKAICRVIGTYPDLPMRPKLQIIFDSQQRRVLTERIVNLPDDPLLYIVDSVSGDELQQIASGTYKKTRLQSGRIPKDDDSDSTAIEAAVVEDQPSNGVEEEQEQTVPAHATRWLKPVLIIGAIVLLITGLIIQFGNQSQEPFDAGKLESPAIKTQPDRTPLKKPADVALPPAVKNRLPATPVQQKAVKVQPSGPQDSGTGQVSTEKALQTDAQPRQTVVAEASVPQKKQEVLPVPAAKGIAPVASPGEPGQNAEPIQRLHPYSVKLAYFRTRKSAEKSLAVYRQKGLAPYWVKVNLGDQGIWYRVFAGYFETVEQAENIIKSRKLNKATVKNTRYANFIGQYRSEKEADKQVQFISKRGFSPYVVKQADSEFYIYVGAFYTRQGALDQYDDLIAAGIKSKVVER